MPDQSHHNHKNRSPTPDTRATVYGTLPPKFALGQVVATPGAVDLLLSAGVDAFELLERHGCGDWGDVEKTDHKLNDRALVEGTRILSAYKLPDNAGCVWIITEADRSSTAILLPSEY